MFYNSRQGGYNMGGSFDLFQIQGSVSQFDGTSWKRTRLENLGLNSCFPSSIAADNQNAKWLGIQGTMGGILVQINNDNWTIPGRSTIPCLQGGTGNANQQKSSIKVIVIKP